MPIVRNSDYNGCVQQKKLFCNCCKKLRAYINEIPRFLPKLQLFLLNAANVSYKMKEKLKGADVL